jgi:hypothetical protein
MADSGVSDRESNKQYEAQPGCQPISLLSFLEAENMRLRQAVVELSLDASALREAVKIVEAPDRVVAESSDRSRLRHADPDRTPQRPTSNTR